MNKRHFNKNASKGSKLTVQFDHTDYVHYLDGMDVTDDQAEEMLMTLWDMMVQFVDFGFNLNTDACLLYTSPSPRDRTRSRMPSSA